MTRRENPRLVGVREQIERARFLLRDAHAESTYARAFPKLMAAVYPARAALEIMRESAKLGELTVPITDFDRRVAELVPLYRLIHAVRIRDFHHYGIQSGGRIFATFQITLPPHGHAEFSMYPDPIHPRASIVVSDPSANRKMLLTSDVGVQDEAEPDAIPYGVLLKEYLDQLDVAVQEFASLLRRPTQPNRR